MQSLPSLSIARPFPDKERMFYTLPVLERYKCAWCGMPPEGDACAHVVAWSDGNTLVSPLDGVALPWLTGDAVRHYWSASQIAASFGDLAPLMDAYAAVADWRPGLSARVLWPLLAEYLGLQVVTALVSPDPLRESKSKRKRTVSTTHPPRENVRWYGRDAARVATSARAIAMMLDEGYQLLDALSVPPAHTLASSRAA